MSSATGSTENSFGPFVFIQEIIAYGRQMSQFKKDDWIVYIAWVGLMSGLMGSTLGFLLLGWSNGVEYPAYVWNVPLGVFIFSAAISFDTIGHRTAYKEYLKKGEALVHHVTIFAGVSSTLLLCLCYSYSDFLRIPTLVLVILSIFYSVVDEALHWHRYMSHQSDRVEMVSHFFIFVGHLIMVFAWWHWYAEGYPGVAETLQYLPF